MARIPGVEAREANLLTRLVYAITKRKIGRVVYPLKVTAHHTRLLMGVGQMELAQEAAKSVDAQLKLLAQVKIAMMIGCPF